MVCQVCGLSASENCYYLLVSTTYLPEILHWSAKTANNSKQLQMCSLIAVFSLGLLVNGCLYLAEMVDVALFQRFNCLSKFGCWYNLFWLGVFVLWFGRVVMWKNPQGLSYPNWRAGCSEREVNSAVTQVVSLVCRNSLVFLYPYRLLTVTFESTKSDMASVLTPCRLCSSH